MLPTRNLAVIAALFALSFPARAYQCPGDDPLEPNDTCVTATDMTATPGWAFFSRIVSLSSEDHYRFVVGPGETISATLDFMVADADVDLELVDSAGCSSVLAVAQSRDDGETLIWRNDFFSTRVVVLRVHVWPGGSGVCTLYDIVVHNARCTAGSDDFLEPNDSCTTGTLLIDGSIPSLVLQAGSPDYFRTTLGAGDGLRLVVRDVSTIGVTPFLQLFDSVADPACVAPIASAVSGSEGLVLLWTNCGATPQNVVACLELLAGSCTTYTLDSDLQSCTPVVDALEPNDDPFSPNVLALPFHQSGLDTTPCNWDWHEATIAPGMFLTALVTNEDPDRIAATTVITSPGGDVFLALPATRRDHERRARYQNVGGSPETVLVLVAAFGDVCGPYTLDVRQSPDPLACAGAADDTYEPNDTCGAAAVLAAEEERFLLVKQSDPDFYRLTVGAGDVLKVDVLHTFADGDVDAQLLDGACGGVLATSATADDDEQLMFTNLSATSVDVVLRVYVPPGALYGCNEYDLRVQRIANACLATADDSFEENDECGSATPLGVGGQSGRVVKRGDDDWYAIPVPAGAYVTFDTTHTDPASSIELALHVGNCVAPPIHGTIVDNLVSSIALDNRFGGERTAYVRVSLSADSAADCVSYILNVLSSLPIGYEAHCFGDGSGTPCPCGANSSPGHPGGCKHDDGQGAILHATGLASSSVDTMRFYLTSAVHDSFAILVSGNNVLPSQGSCIGCGVAAFDGLRCAGGAFLRHGTRALNGEGATTNSWGPPNGPAGGLIASAGFTVGQTRSFFAYYRTDPAGGCGGGQNSSNAQRVQIRP